MSWRIIQITQACKLSIKNRQLLYEPFSGDSLVVPMEDISVIVLDQKQVSLTGTFLSELAEYNIVLFTSNTSHLPSGILFPFHGHSRYSEMAWQQVEMSEPLKKRLWQEIIKQKITNQAMVLHLLKKDNARLLDEISKQVQSGDSKNAEAFAANIYWKSLFYDFNRNKEDDIRNAALNYGYAIIRGCLARSVVGAGLLPCFGIHHANKLNQFNLVDDLIEPYRAFVDYKVNCISFGSLTELNSSLKNILISILTDHCIIDKQELTLLKSIEIFVNSVAKVVRSKNVKELKCPEFKK